MAANYPYTLEDLEEARREVKIWDDRYANDSSNNPDKYQSQRKSARDKVRWITAELKAAGILETSKAERLYQKLDRAYPLAKSKEVVLFEGRYYQRRFKPLERSRSRKTITLWGGYWVQLEEDDRLVVEYKETHPDGSTEPLWDGWVRWVRPNKDRVCPKCETVIQARTVSVLAFSAPVLSRPAYFDRLAVFRGTYVSYFYLCLDCSNEVLNRKFRIATKGGATRPNTFVLTDLREHNKWPVFMTQRLSELGLGE